METDFWGNPIEAYEVAGDALVPKAKLPAGRSNILRLERAVAKLPQYDCPLKHYFVDGLYVREIFIPKGCVLVGYIHTQPCITIVSQGRILISEGTGTREVAAPYTTTVPSGSKKAGYALEDTIWSDCYLNPDNERDINTLEARLTANSHDEYLLRQNVPQIEEKQT